MKRRKKNKRLGTSRASLKRSSPHYSIWEEFCTKVDEAYHHSNADFLHQKNAGVVPNPESQAEMYRKVFDAAATAVVYLVTDHESAENCAKELEKCSRDLLRAFHKLIDEIFPASARDASQGTLARLEWDIKERLERAKADIYKAALEAPVKPKRLDTTTITSRSGAARLRAHLESTGTTQASFADDVGGSGISARTVRRFLQTGRTQRYIFDCIARTIGITSADLEKPLE